MRRAQVFDLLADFTADQHGLFTRAQAASIGVSDQVLEYFLGAGDLERVARGVYRFRRDLPDRRQGLWAAWLQLAPEQTAYERTRATEIPDAVVSHTSAADLYELGVLFPERHEFTVSVPRRTRRADVRLHRDQISEGEWEVVDGLPATRPQRIVIDLLADRRDADHVAHAAADALDRELVTRAELESQLAPFAAHYGGPEGDGSYMLSFLLAEDAAELVKG